MSATRKVYFARLIGRIGILLLCIRQYILDRTAFDLAFDPGLPDRLKSLGDCHASVRTGSQ